MRHALTLSELNSMVAEAVAVGVPNEYVVCAELAGVRESRGHCYMELVEKDPLHNTPVARASAKCWRSTWQVLSPAFARITGEQLHAGMKVMLTVTADFHVAYGFSWTVIDISAEYSLGEMARRRHEVIDTLRKEGVFDLQHELELPRFCQRVAVISAENAAGYGDFVDQLEHNSYGLVFYTKLFPAVMQGELVESSVSDALGRIFGMADEFDCVAIIRGGGATSDLAGFDTLPLSEHIANFPLPILTGIGHERDESVADMVACVKLKTPTAVAAFLIDRLRQTADFLDSAAQKLRDRAAVRIEAERKRLDTVAERMLMAAREMSQSRSRELEIMAGRLPAVASMRLQRESHRLELIAARMHNLDPKLMLRRGYAIVRHDGKVQVGVSKLHAGDTVDITFGSGRATAVIDSVSDKTGGKSRT